MLKKLLETTKRTLINFDSIKNIFGQADINTNITKYTTTSGANSTEY